MKNVIQRLFLATCNVIYCLSSTVVLASEANVLGTYTIKPLGISESELGPPLPFLITLLPDHTVDYVFDGDGPSKVSLCESNWTSEQNMLVASLNCSNISPEMVNPFVIKMDLSNVTEEMLTEEKGVSVPTNLTCPGMVDRYPDNWSGTIALAKTTQGPLDISNLFIRSGDGAGLKKRDTTNGCCLDDDCDISLPCKDVEIGYSNRIGIRLVFDKNVEELGSVELLKNHLRRAYLEITFEMTSKAWEFARVDNKAIDIVFTGLRDGRMQFTASGIIEKSIRIEWKGGIDGEQTYEEVNPLTPFNISFDLETLYPVVQ